MNEKKLRLRFTYEDDLILLREFINNNPITNREGWQQIQNNVLTLTQKHFTIRTLKQHLMLLLKIFLKKTKVDEVRSGIEVPLNEKDTLLEEVSSMCKEAKYSIKPTRKKTGLTKDQQLCLLGKTIRHKYAEDYYCLDEEDRENAEENTADKLKTHIFEEHDYIILDGVENEVEIEHSQREQASIYNNPQPSPSQLSREGSSHVSMNMGSKKTPTKLSKYTNKNESTPTDENILINKDSRNNDGTFARNVLVPTRKRRQREPVRKNALSYLTNKQQIDLEVKKKEIDLENRKLDIEEKKIKLDEKRIVLQEKQCELEHKERVERLDLEKKRVEIELQEKQITQQLLQSQQIIINKFLKEYIE